MISSSADESYLPRQFEVNSSGSDTDTVWKEAFASLQFPPNSSTRPDKGVRKRGSSSRVGKCGLLVKLCGSRLS
ncbi:hypothetical protein CEXT_414301 [Caerostris extrusa]|uniref:Uncharacterized protein n=1 Tax=Caerostris extrusa TaxID=172846 RepID=A0AAV4QLG2_CAEEX|nr:hypothetical protein CEXT_414301 [Caerostris extrusa]